MVGSGDLVELACHAFGHKIDYDRATRSWRLATANFDSKQETSFSSIQEELAEQLVNSGPPEIDTLQPDPNKRKLNQDLITLVFWYKDSNPSPIYTLDARHANSVATLRDNRSNHDGITSSNLNVALLANAKHYHSSGRFQLDATSHFPVLVLSLRGAQASDSGQYRCRVDFRQSPTQNQKIPLLVQGKRTTQLHKTLNYWTRHQCKLLLLRFTYEDEY